MMNSSSSTCTAGGETYGPVFNRSYFQCAVRAYNMTRFVVSELRMDDTVFNTGMWYWHEFVSVWGLRRINEVVLAAACVFLAGKVEHYKLRVDQVVALVFEVSPTGGGSEDAGAAGWRDMVLEVELVLSDFLKFDFQRQQPVKQMLEWLSHPWGKEPRLLSAEENQLVSTVQATVNRIFTLSLIAPLYVRISAEHVAVTIAYMATHYAGHGAPFAHVWETQPLPPESERDAIMGVIVDAFAYMRKRTGIAVVDDRIDGRRKRMRRETPTLRPSAASNNGGGGGEAAPGAQPLT